MKFKIVDMKTNITSAWCNNIKTANKIKNDFYKTDMKLYNMCNGYMILLNEKEESNENLYD